MIDPVECFSRSDVRAMSKLAAGAGQATVDVLWMEICIGRDESGAETFRLLHGKMETE
jgi:hypothetical protein